jgi:transcriptional regulator GlxA family with amidase domain
VGARLSPGTHCRSGHLCERLDTIACCLDIKSGQSRIDQILDGHDNRRGQIVDGHATCIQNALSFAEKNLGASLTVDKLAEAASLSPRQFSRAFLAETGQTPAKAVEKLRLEAARLMIEQSHHPIEVVARETGFVDRRRMRDAFLRTFGQPPQIIRRNARP